MTGRIALCLTLLMAAPFATADAARNILGFGGGVTLRTRLDNRAGTLLPRQRPLHGERSPRSYVFAQRPGPYLVYATQPIRPRPGHTYLLVLGWYPSVGTVEAAYVAYSAAGTALTEPSLRVTLGKSGQAFVSAFAPGDDDQPFHFPAERAELTELPVTRSGEYAETRVLIDPAESDPLGRDVPYVELVFGLSPGTPHGELSSDVRLYDLSAGLDAFTDPQSATVSAVAPLGVPLNPLRLPTARERPPTLGIQAARGETRSIGIAIQGALTCNATLSARELTFVRAAAAAPGGGEPETFARIDRRQLALTSILAQPAASRADPLVPADERREGSCYYRLSVAVPDGVRPGTYAGDVRIVPDLGAPVLYHLQVEVADLSAGGNIVADPGFELLEPLLKEEDEPRWSDGWTIRDNYLGPVGSPLEGKSEPEEDAAARSGGRTLRLKPGLDRTRPAVAQSRAFVFHDRGSHRLGVAMQVEGAPASVEVTIPGLGSAKLTPLKDARQPTLELGEATLGDPRLETDSRGWQVLSAVIDPAERRYAQIELRVWPAAAHGAAAWVRFDDVELVPLPRAFERASRFESLIPNGGFEQLTDGTPRRPYRWTVAAPFSPVTTSVTPTADVTVERPVSRGERAVAIAAAGLNLGDGLELRSAPFAIERGARLEAQLWVRSRGVGAGLRIAFRAFDDDGEPLPTELGARLEAADGSLELTPVGAVSVAIGAADETGFHEALLRVLDLPSDARTMTLALRADDEVPEGTAVVVDEVRVAALRSPWVGGSADLRSFARWYGVPLWDPETDVRFTPLFESLAELGIKPQVPTPESFHDFEHPFPSVAPAIDDPVNGERWAEWGWWWWRRGFFPGALGPLDEIEPTAIAEFYDAWLPAVTVTTLDRMAWAAAPVEPCPRNPRRQQQLERWAAALDDAAPTLRRLGKPCSGVDLVEREALLGLLDIWILSLDDLTAVDRADASSRAAAPGTERARRPVQSEARGDRTIDGAATLHELREAGDLLWLDLVPYVTRLDGPPAEPRAAVLAAWHFGFDGHAFDGLASWREMPGLGNGVDGSFTLRPSVRSAPGVLLWPGRQRRVDPSSRLRELAAGIADVRYLRRLEQAVSVAETLVAELGGSLDDEPDSELAEERDRLAAAIRAGAEALRAAHTTLEQPVYAVAAAELEASRTVTVEALARLLYVSEAPLLRAAGLEQRDDGWWIEPPKRQQAATAASR